MHREQHNGKLLSAWRHRGWSSYRVTPPNNFTWVPHRQNHSLTNRSSVRRPVHPPHDCILPPVRTNYKSTYFPSSNLRNNLIFQSTTEREKKEKRDKQILNSEKMAQNADQTSRHQEVGHKSLLQSDALYQVWKINDHIYLGLYLFQIVIDSRLNPVLAVHSWNQCVSKRARAHERAERNNCQSSMVS